MGLTTILLIILGMVAILVGYVLAIKQINTPEKLEAKYANSAEKNNVFVKKIQRSRCRVLQIYRFRNGLIDCPWNNVSGF
jgi:hypothetical protein